MKLGVGRSRWEVRATGPEKLGLRSLGSEAWGEKRGDEKLGVRSWRWRGGGAPKVIKKRGDVILDETRRFCPDDKLTWQKLKSLFSKNLMTQSLSSKIVMTSL